MKNLEQEQMQLSSADAAELYMQFSSAAILPHEKGLASLIQISSELKARNQQSIETSLAFITLMESSSLATSRGADNWGGIATRFSLRVREIDREVGMRKVHDLLTNRNHLFRNGSWIEIERWNNNAKLPYDDYHSFYVLRAIGSSIRTTSS